MILLPRALWRRSFRHCSNMPRWGSWSPVADSATLATRRRRSNNGVAWLVSSRTQTTTTTTNKKEEASSSTTATTTTTTPSLSALDQSILQLALTGPSHLPRLWREFLQANQVCYITQDDDSNKSGIEHALTLPDRDGDLHPAVFSSRWTAQRYLQDDNDLRTALPKVTIHTTTARAFLQHTRPATVLLNPPVFTLNPALIDDLLQFKFDHVENNNNNNEPESNSVDNDDDAPNGGAVAAVDNVRYETPTQPPSSSWIQQLTDFLEPQSSVVAAYVLQKQQQQQQQQGDDDTMIVAILCHMTHVEEFEQDVQQELQHVLNKQAAFFHDNRNNKDGKFSILCLNQLTDMDVFASIVDEHTPFYLNIGRMADVEFTLFSDKIAVGPAPSNTEQTDLLLQHLAQKQGTPTSLDAGVIYQVVYQIAGYPMPPKVGTFWETSPAEHNATSSVAPQVCLHRGYGALNELMPEMADYIRQNVKPVKHS